MILILSSSNDSSTIEVVRWLEHYGATNRVVFPKDLLQNINLLDFSQNSILKYLEDTIGVKINFEKVREANLRYAFVPQATQASIFL